MTERNLEGTEAEPRFTGTGSHKPEFPAEIGYMGYVGAKDSDRAPFRAYRAVVAAAVLLVICFGVAALIVWLH